MRLTRKVFNDLGIFMMGFGLAIGVVFPLFITLLGVPKEYTFTKTFFVACVSAGLIAGFVNYFIARIVVGKRLQNLTNVGIQMRTLAETMREAGSEQANQDFDFEKTFTGDLSGKLGCHINVDSDDEFGESAKAFNFLAETLSRTITAERAARSFTTMLATDLDLAPLAEKAIQKLILYTNSSSGLLAVIDQGKLKIAANDGLLEPEEILQSSQVAHVIRTNKKQIITTPDTTEAVTIDHRAGKTPAEYVLVYPIVYKNISLGVIVLASENEYDQEILGRLDLLSMGLGLALNNSLTHGHMRELATLDPLTEIYNRGFGVQRLHEEYIRSVRNHSPLGLIIFDIDDFKAINDTYGHLSGDKVLINIVNSAKKVLREGDILVRYGGEEFLAVLPGASLADVGIVGDRIRRAISDLAIKAGEDIMKVTISLGGVSHPELNASNEETLVHQADVSLYRAKNSGKDKIELHVC